MKIKHIEVQQLDSNEEPVIVITDTEDFAYVLPQSEIIEALERSGQLE